MRLTAFLLMTLSACTQFPELDGTIAPELVQGAAPDLIPLGPLLLQAEAADQGAAEVETEISPRLANLRGRAAGLRGPVIAPAIRARMLRGVR
ncbi:hypothetical protein Q4555_11105 [Octadecabacter sp. 1_MG-2023]|uniref:hypothetical protein n=1 Tax=unclassified Octadecabacter TaxID=196158 RepID=UPI001C0947DD|nr:MULTISPECIES: hypothetical protein [unclassified Octadecabacter]MBU2993936.1 hypothetical protein [Octadecabacter sp. B2R22]MDO6735218.1 hypothetical protein [Octadecabacter sp. 1_MG-2023]